MVYGVVKGVPEIIKSVQNEPKGIYNLIRHDIKV